MEATVIKYGRAFRGASAVQIVRVISDDMVLVSDDTSRLWAVQLGELLSECGADKWLRIRGDVRHAFPGADVRAHEAR